jgi:hypothetical protein
MYGSYELYGNVSFSTYASGESIIRVGILSRICRWWRLLSTANPANISGTAVFPIPTWGQLVATACVDAL